MLEVFCERGDHGGVDMEIWPRGRRCCRSDSVVGEGSAGCCDGEDGWSTGTVPGRRRPGAIDIGDSGSLPGKAVVRASDGEPRSWQPATIPFEGCFSQTLNAHVRKWKDGSSCSIPCCRGVL